MSTPRSWLLLVILVAVTVASCAPASGPTAADPQMTEAVGTAMASIMQTQAAAVPASTATPEAIPTVQQPLPALPGPYPDASLHPGDTPHTYITDTCQYLKDKWTSSNSAPGTIAMTIMFHGIEKGENTVSDPKNVGSGQFKQIMNGLHDMGFQAINTEQMADFLDHNARIPTRSVLLIQDDRHAAGNFNDWFRPYWEKWQWPVVNGWISALGGSDPVLAENVELEQEGWVDHQAHGVVHNIPMSDTSSDEFLTGELEGSITNIETYFKKTPIAIIWPGGGFGVRPVQFARKYGYRLGFTINPRGPIMYNWVPLADQADPGRPLYIPEGPVNDPRMVLPRYWPEQVLPNLDAVRLMGEQAAAYAQQNRPTELQYYQVACQSTYGPIP